MDAGMNTTEHGLRIHRRYRFDLAEGSALWTIDGTVSAIYDRRGTWSVHLAGYSGIVNIHRDGIDRRMTVAGHGLTVPLENIIHAEEITQ